MQCALESLAKKSIIFRSVSQEKTSDNRWKSGEHNNTALSVKPAILIPIAKCQPIYTELADLFTAS